MSKFSDIVQYAASKSEQAFSSWQEAEAAYLKHIARKQNKEYSDPLKVFFTEYHKRFRKFFSRKDIKSSWYDFKEVKEFLKKNDLWGMQVFDCHANEATDLIYNESGLCICVNHYYGYVDVVGLRDCDFKVLERVHNAIFE